VAEAVLAVVTKNLKAQQAMLAHVQQQIEGLQASYDESVAEKQSLEQNMILTTNRLSRAGKLTTALADEKVRWEESVVVSLSFSSSLTSNVARTQSIKDHTLITALWQCWMVTNCQTRPLISIKSIIIDKPSLFMSTFTYSFHFLLNESNSHTSNQVHVTIRSLQ